jgi:hypothetical protein
MFEPPSELDSPKPVFPPAMVLSLLAVAAIFGALVGNALSYLVCFAANVDMSELVNGFDAESPLMHRNLLRAVTLLSHICTFILPAAGMAWFLFRKENFAFLKMTESPHWQQIGWGTLFIIAVFPLAQFTYFINKQVPLPEVLRGLEDSTEALIKGFLVMDSPVELIFNLLVIALVPAIGEEMIFRGVVQQTLERWLKHPVAAVWAGAAVFSFIHFQFEGFLPRMVLGAALGYLFYWTRNLWVPVAGHFINNALQVVAAYMMPDQVDAMDMNEMDGASWGMTAVSIVLTVWIAKIFIKNKETFPVSENPFDRENSAG